MNDKQESMLNKTKLQFLYYWSQSLELFIPIVNLLYET